LGNKEEGSFTRDFEGGELLGGRGCVHRELLKRELDSGNRASLPLWALCEGGSFAGNPEGYVEEDSGEGHLIPLGPRWGTWKGAHIQGTLRN
jgi:hypothetical protein